MTHLFHPLHGREFELLECRSSWGESRVWFRDDAGRVRHLLASWTDVVGEDPVVAVGRGRSRLRVNDLVRLADLVGRLASAVGGEE